MITVFCNGDRHELPDSCSIAELLQSMGVDRTRVAVERNDSLVPRQFHGDCKLQEGDHIEIVTLVGGG